MQKVEPNLDQVAIDAFSLTLEDIVDYVLANAAPPSRTFQCTGPRERQLLPLSG